MNSKLLTLLGYAGLSLTATHQTNAQDSIEDECYSIKQYSTNIKPLEEIFIDNLHNGCCNNGSCNCNASC